MKKIYIGMSRDHSASMRFGGVTEMARQDYNTLIAAFRNQATKQGIDTVVSVVKCGVGNHRRGVSAIEREVVISSVAALKDLTSYIADGGSTPLYDSVGDLIEQFESMPDANDPEVSFVIMAVTDGGENASIKWPVTKLKNKIRELQDSDRWSFTFRVPKSHGAGLIRDLNLHAGNVLEWVTTSAGMATSTTITTQAVERYFSDRVAGTRSTKTFFTNLNEVSAADVKSTLKDISKDVQTWTVQTAAEGVSIRSFCEAKSGTKFLKGAAFYQLTKTESEVQDYKKIVIRIRKTGQVYSGDAARQMLGLPTTGTVRVAPGDHGLFDIFIQSTSVNRKLPVGTTVLYWTGVGTAYKEGASAPVAPTQVSNLPAPTAAPAKASQYAGLKAPAAKPAKPTKTVKASEDDKRNAYIAGYKAGRGKQKNRTAEYTVVEVRDQYVQGFADGKAKTAKRFAF